MGQNKAELQEVVLRQIFLDAFNDKPFTNSKQLQVTLRKHQKVRGKNVTDLTLCQQVSSILLQLRRQNVICKPIKSTPQDGNWTMTPEMLREFRNRFVRRHFYKHKFCNHLETKKVVLQGWDYEITEYRCPVLKSKIENPEIHCDSLHGSKTVMVEVEVEDKKTKIKRKELVKTWCKCEITMCSGYTRSKSTSESLQISSALIWDELKDEIKDFISRRVNKQPWREIEEDAIHHLPYSFRGTDINSILNLQELKEKSERYNLNPNL